VLKRRQAPRHFLLQLPDALLKKIEMGQGLFEQKPMMEFQVPLQSLFGPDSLSWNQRT
jgi:hypothetical protein